MSYGGAPIVNLPMTGGPFSSPIGGAPDLGYPYLVPGYGVVGGMGGPATGNLTPTSGDWQYRGFYGGGGGGGGGSAMGLVGPAGGPGPRPPNSVLSPFGTWTPISSFPPGYKTYAQLGPEDWTPNGQLKDPSKLINDYSKMDPAMERGGGGGGGWGGGTAPSAPTFSAAPSAPTFSAAPSAPTFGAAPAALSAQTTAAAPLNFQTGGELAGQLGRGSFGAQPTTAAAPSPLNAAITKAAAPPAPTNLGIGMGAMGGLGVQDPNQRLRQQQWMTT